VVISFNVTGLGLHDEAGREATQAAQTANSLLDALTRAALTAFCSGLDTISMPLVPFMSGYVARLRALVKRGQQLPQGAQGHIQVRSWAAAWAAALLTTSALLRPPWGRHIQSSALPLGVRQLFSNGSVRVSYQHWAGCAGRRRLKHGYLQWSYGFVIWSYDMVI
jgi:hypothetical protein